MLVIALDGATFDLIRPLCEQGQLPCLREIMSRGCALHMRSTTPPITPPAWSSFATGVAPREHGVFGFNYPDPSDYSLRLTSAADVGQPTIWRRLSEQGIGTLLIDVPFTFPPEDTSGCIVAGFPLPESGDFTSPRDLPARLDEARVPCRRHPNEAPDPSGVQFEKWLDELLGERVRLFRHLTERVGWRFAMIGSMAVDWAQHALWRYCDGRFVFSRQAEAEERREALAACYRRLDRFVADLVEIAGDDVTVVIASDHGFATTFHYDWIATALEKAGLLFRRRGRGPIEHLRTAVLRAARRSPRLLDLGKRAFGDTESVRKWARRTLAYSMTDWERTRVFPAGDYNLNLYVNSRARFARGIVAENEFEKVVEETIAALEAFRPPGHETALVSRIVRIEGGRRKLPTRVPDLSLQLTVLPAALGETDPSPVAGICGFHSPEGILITSSADWLGRPCSNQTIDITEVAGAILGYFGIEAGAEISERSSRAAAFSKQDEAALLDRLRHIGYLD